MSWLGDVEAFCREAEKHGQPTSGGTLVDLRRRLIMEELVELEDAWAARNFVAFVDAIADALYVVLGAVVTLPEVTPHYSESMRYSQWILAEDSIGFCGDVSWRDRVGSLWLDFGSFAAAASQHDWLTVCADCEDLVDSLLMLANECGVSMGPIFAEVHRSNMAKFQGGYVDSNGKFRKPADWQAPDIEGELRKQGWTP